MTIDERELTRSLQGAGLVGLRSGPPPLSDQLGVLVSAAADLLKVDCVGVLLLDEAGRVRTVAAYRTGGGGPRSSAGAVAVRSGRRREWPPDRSLAVVDLADRPRVPAGSGRSWPTPGCVECWLRPSWSASEVVGNLNAVTAQRQHWSDADRRGGAGARRPDRRKLLTAHRDRAIHLGPRRACAGDGTGGAGATGDARGSIRRRWGPACAGCSGERAAVLAQSLRQLVTACVDLFGVGGSGVMLADERGDLRYAVATDPTSQELEDAQLATGQGPCVDTYVSDSWSPPPTCTPTTAGPSHRAAGRKAGPRGARRPDQAGRGHRRQPRRVPGRRDRMGLLGAGRADPLRRDRRRDADRRGQPPSSPASWPLS